MFGQPQQNTPFGQQNSAPAFGSSAPGGLFGAAPAPAFGAAPAPAFGTPFGGGGAGGFGQPAQTPAFGQASSTGLFGQPAPAPSAFGGFGAVPAPATGSIFGGGQPAGAPSAFGQTATPAFGQPPASAFGQAPSTSPFGGTTSTFGQAPAPAFGTSTFGGFGQPAPAPSTGLFGQPAPAPSLFGQSAPATGGFSFGSSAPAPTGSLFGAPAPAGGFGFGAPAPAPTGGLFGSTAPAPAFGAPVPSLFGVAQSAGEGTRAVPFQPTTKKDNQSNITLQSITGMQQYENKSFEELRFEDYSSGNKGQASAPAPATSAGFSFGAAPAPASTGGLFGSTASAPAFGAPAPSTFGGFGAAPASGGLFGSKPTSTFGAPATTTGLFGSPSPAPFGAPSPAPLFGQPAPAPSAFGTPAPSSGGLFGSAPSSGFSFGAPNPAPFGAAPSTGLFGAPNPAPFGAPSPAPLFGASSLAPFGAPAPSSGGLFASAPSTGFSFGAPSPAPLFGAAPSTTGFFGAPSPAPLFGAPQQQAPPPGVPQPVISQNTVILAPTADESNMQGIRALLKTKEEMEKNAIWFGDGVKSKVSTPTSVSERDSLDPGSVSRFGGNKFIWGSSAFKIRPRGFPKTESPKAAPILSNLGRGGSDLMPPDSNFRSPAMQLVVHPGSLSKPALRNKPSPRDKESPALNLPAETVTSPPTDPSPSPETSPPAAHFQTKLVDERPAASSTTSIATQQQPSAAAKASPELESYYQKTINTSTEPSSIGQASNLKSRLAPKLTKKGYETTPPMDELGSYSDAELATVADFSVSRPGYGKVEWLGAVDIRGADLDRIVVIEPKDVSVYSEEEREGTKPLEGTRLNRPAEITYCEVFPKDNPDASLEEKQKFKERLEKNTRKMGAEFISYNKVTGEWKIRVRHFSRYALVLDDESDEEQRPSTPQEDFRPKPVMSRKATPYPIVKFSLSPEEAEITADRVREHVRASAEKALAEVAVPEEAPVEQDQEESVIEDDGEDDYDTVLMYEFVPPAQPSASKFSIVAATVNKHQTQLPSIDAGFRMGRSFRAAWAPDGSVISPQGGTYTIAKLAPVHSDDADNQEVVLRFLEIQLQFASRFQEGGCPLFCLPSSLFMANGTKQSHLELLKALNEFGEIPGKTDEGRSCFKMIAYLLGSPEAASNQATKATGVRNVPKEALLRWLVDECELGVSQQIEKALSSGAPLAAVFAAFSAGDIERACTVAAGEGLHDLACVIATVLASGAEKSDLGRIVLEHSAGQSLPLPLERLTKNIAGDNHFEDGHYRSGRSYLDWRNRMALRTLNSSNEGILEIIDDLARDFESGSVPFPKPSYSSSKKDEVQSVQFKILRAMSSPSPQQLSDIINPAGFTAFHNDVSLSFHLASVLAGVMPFAGVQEDFDRVCSSYACQLICEDQWVWAVFVMLCVPPNAGTDQRQLRVALAKSILLRYFNDNNAQAEVDRQFLEQEIGIPAEWFPEALSGRSLNVLDYISHTLNFDPQVAIQVIETRYLPIVFFMSRNQVDKLMHMIEGLATTRNSVADGVRRLFKLAKNLKKVRVRADRDVPAALNQLIAEHDYLSTLFKARLSSAGSTSGDYRFYIENPTRVTLGSMLREALNHLDDIRLQIDLVRDSQPNP